MKIEIMKQIKKIEKEEKIKVVYLVESGSRAWKWESQDSDYDVRGVFIQDYNKFEGVKKQINYIVGNLDIEIWDAKKFFELFCESNPSVWEWLSSDIIYKESSEFIRLKKIFQGSFNHYKLKKHYLSMARQNYEKYINNCRDRANLKKYLYVLRSIACINYIEKNNLPPPKNYQEILSYLPQNVRDFFKKIVRDKSNSEKAERKRNKEVDKYIISFWKKDFKKEEGKFDMDKLENVFKKLVGVRKYEN